SFSKTSRLAFAAAQASAFPVSLWPYARALPSATGPSNTENSFSDIKVIASGRYLLLNPLAITIMSRTTSSCSDHSIISGFGGPNLIHRRAVPGLASRSRQHPPLKRAAADIFAQGFPSILANPPAADDRNRSSQVRRPFS